MGHRLPVSQSRDSRRGRRVLPRRRPQARRRGRRRRHRVVAVMMRARRPGGFTLIEILVVVVIIGVIIGLASVQLMRSPGDLVREESDHLALLLRAAREEAILQGRWLAFGAGGEPYRFPGLGATGWSKATQTA